MAKLTAQEAAQKHATRTKAATEDMKKGVQKVTENPCEKAAASQDKMLAHLQESVSNGKWAAGLRKVTLEDWKTKMISKGAPRVAAGIDAALPKTTAFMNELLPAIDSAKAEISSMPSMTLEDNINRMNTYVRRMAQFRKSS